jgi:hypothetical protein
MFFLLKPIPERPGRANPAVLGTILFGIAIIAGTLAIVVPPSLAPAGRQAKKNRTASREASVVRAVASPEESARVEESAAVRERLEGDAALSEMSSEPGRAVLEGFAIFSKGDPAASARIEAVRYKDLDDCLPHDSWETFETMSAADGWFAFKNIPPGGYSVQGVMEGFAGHLKVSAAGCADHPDGRPVKHRLVLKQSGTIQGRVTGPGDKPISGALVSVSDIPAAAARTDEEGRFALADLVAGVHTIIASASGMGFTVKHRVPTPTTDLEIVMNEGGSVSGTVTLNDKPVAGIQVRAVMSNSIPMSTKLERTDGKGRYRFGSLGDGKYCVDVLIDRHAAEKRYPTVRPGEETEGIDFALERCASIVGKVVRKSDETPLEGIWVCAVAKKRNRYAMSSGATHCRTDAEGRFALSPLPPQDYQIAALNGQGYCSSFWNDGKVLELESGEPTKDLMLALEPGGVLDIKVTKESGEVMEGVKITLDHADRDSVHASSYRNRHLFLPKTLEKGGGLYRLEGIPPGVYNLWTSVPGWNYDSETLVVEEGVELETVEMVLKPGFSVPGRVTDADNAGIPNACVNPSSASSAITDGEGNFLLEGLTSGYQRLYVYAEGYANYYKRHSSLSEDDEILITLEPSGSHFLAGRVVNDLIEPLPKVKITVSQYSGANRLSREVVSRDDGSFRADGLLEEEARIRVDTSWGRPRLEKSNFHVDQSDLELIVERFGTVKGRVLDEEGLPCEAFEVRSRTRKIWRGTDYAPFTDGAFEITEALPGKVRVYARTEDGREAQSDWFDLEPAQTVDDLELILTEVGALSGMVRDAATNKPVSGAALYVDYSGDDDIEIYSWRQPEAITGADGLFELEGLRTGVVHLSVAHPDYRSVIGVAQEVVAKKKIEGVDILLVRGAGLCGHVYVDGEGRPGVQVEARELEGNSDDTDTITGASGHYAIKNLEPGPYEVTAKLDEEDGNNTILSRNITVGAAGHTVCDFFFAPGASLEGSITLFGKPARKVYISADVVRKKKDDFGDGRSSRGGSRSDDQGFYRLGRLSPGLYRVYAYSYQDRDRYSFSQEVALAGGVNHLDVRLGEGGSAMITGCVLSGGIPQPDISVRLSGDKFRTQQMTDETGFFRFENLSAGSMSLRVSVKSNDQDRSFSLYRRFTLKEGESRHVDLVCETGSGVIYGTIFLDGLPMEDPEHLYLSREARGDQGWMSTNLHFDGSDYRIGGLPPGRYRLSCYDPWYMIQYVDVSDRRDARLDFVYASGDARIEATVTQSEKKDKKAGSPSVYLFKPGTCPWKKGEVFHHVNSTQGFVAELGARSGGRYTCYDLPPGAIDVVAVVTAREGDPRILALDLKTTILSDDEKTYVTLDVRGEEGKN